MSASSRSRSPVHERAARARAEFARHLLTHAATVAPSDVTALLGRAAELRHRLVAERDVHPELAQRARLALDLLTDHERGACPQIPLYTVGLLATALLYYLAPIDVIPDFIPRTGTADDALVVDVAWQLATPGIRRYLDARELDVSGLDVLADSDDVPPAGAPRRKRTRTTPTAKPARRR